MIQLILKIFKITFVVILSLIGLFILAVIIGLGLGIYSGMYSASRAYSKIKVGMSVAEAERALEGGHHTYRIIALDSHANKECEVTKSEYEKCKTSEPSDVTCEEKFPAFDYEKGACVGPSYGLETFVQLVTDDEKDKAKYQKWEAEIFVAYSGPGLMSSSFSVNFDRSGKVSSISKMERTD